MASLEKKHIAIFGIKYFPSKGGTSRVVESLLQYFKDEYQITIYCYKHPLASTNIPGIHTIQIPEPRIAKLGVFLYFVKCMIHALARGNYQLVHVHKTEASFFIPWLRLKFPIIVTSHEIPYLNSKWGIFGKIYFHLAEWLFMFSGATRTSISKTQCEYYGKKYNRSVQYIPNGISTPAVANNSEWSSFMKKHEIEEDYLFFAARRIIPLKGCHHMINALKRIKYQGQVVIAGDMNQMKEYSAELIKSSKGLNVKFVNYISSVPILNALARQAKAFIFPSEIEGMSMMLLEVAILDTPIICSDIPQNQVIFEDNHVLYFRSKDDKDLAEKINYALSHRDEMKKAAKSARDHALSRYSIERVVEEYRFLYNQHLGLNSSHEPA